MSARTSTSAHSMAAPTAEHEARAAGIGRLHLSPPVSLSCSEVSTRAQTPVLKRATGSPVAVLTGLAQCRVWLVRWHQEVPPGGGCLVRTQDPWCASATRGSEDAAGRRQGCLDCKRTGQTGHWVSCRRRAGRSSTAAPGLRASRTRIRGRGGGARRHQIPSSNVRRCVGSARADADDYATIDGDDDDGSFAKLSHPLSQRA